MCATRTHYRATLNYLYAFRPRYIPAPSTVLSSYMALNGTHSYIYHANLEQCGARNTLQLHSYILRTAYFVSCILAAHRAKAPSMAGLSRPALAMVFCVNKKAARMRVRMAHNVVL